MENSPLRKAHEAGRQAVKLQKKGLFEEAAELHLLAATLLQELRLRVPTDSSVVCSLEEQSKYHKRQAELAELIKSIYDKDKLKRLMMAEKNVPKQSEIPRAQRMNRVISAIHQEEAQLLKNFDEADSLLQILTNSEGQRASAGKGVGGIQIKPPSYTVHPRKDSEVIEELQTVNLNLRTLVDSLVKQLHECREENKSLKARLEMYESSEKKSQIFSASALQIAEVYDRLPVRELPELAPLEEPDFDFSAYNF